MFCGCAFPFLPICITFASSFISRSIIFFVFISASVCSFCHLDFCYVILEVFLPLFVSLSFILSSFSVSWSVSIFLSLALLSPQLLQSHKPSRPCSRQPPITGLQEMRGGGCREMGAWKCWGAVATTGKGEAKKSREMSLPEGSHSCLHSRCLDPFPAEQTPVLSFRCEAGYLGPSHLLPKP